MSQSDYIHRKRIANQVALTLIRKAKTLNYEQTQRLEMNAAKNIIMTNQINMVIIFKL